jgi:hypothetical protein
MSEKWWDMSDDELDDLFREASDKAEIPFDSSALDKLRQKIDLKPMPQPEAPRGFKKRWLALVGLLIFFGVALLYTFSGKKEDSKIVDEKTPTMANKANSQVIEDKTNTKTNEIEHEKDLKELGNLPNNKKSEVIVDGNNSSETNASKGNSTNNASVIEKKITQDKNSTIVGNSTSKKWYKRPNEKGLKHDYSFNKKPINQEISNDNSQDNSLKNKTLDISNIKPTDEKTPTAISEINSDNSTVTKEGNNNNEVDSPTISYSSKTNGKQSKFKKSKINSNQVDNPSIYSETNASILTPTIVSGNSPVEEEKITRTDFYNVDILANKATKSLETNVESESPTYVDAPPIVMKQPKFSRFGIRLAIAPEINSIERMETSAVVGSLFGLLLEYRITKKLTLQTGVNYSKKKYTGDFEYYRAWTGGTGTKPLTVDGICSVVDIPINLRLNAFQMNRNTFFISGGVSSYIMSDEVYSYNYAWGPPKIRDWTGNSSSFYWSTLNLSAGVERKINKHFTLQIEPFLKTPLVGVGRGLVNLYSSGLLFSTKYEF